MSSDSKSIDPIHEHIGKQAQLEKKKNEVQQKELKVKERRLDNELEKMAERDRDAELAKITDYGKMTDEEIEYKQKENTEYMRAARNKMCFINERFDKAIPFFRKNLILIGGKTGEGKSTTVANIIRETLKRVDPITGKKRRILVLTNEEKSEDIFNRVTCLIKGWNYVNHDQFTDEQIQIFNEYIKLLSSTGMLTVIDDSYNKAGGTTTTLEGICQVFENLLEHKEYYDVVILDYYQKVQESRKFPSMNEWEVQSALANKLDRYKNVYPAPIVVLAQVAQPDAENKIPFKTRIEGRKVILNVCTCALEMVANREDLVTEWWIHKSRFNEAVGQKITTGYKNGRFVLYDDAFKDAVAKMKAARERENFDKQVRMPVVQEEESNE
jgi:replicative DNA helicase